MSDILMNRFLKTFKRNRLLSIAVSLLFVAIITCSIINFYIADHINQTDVIQTFSVIDSLPDGQGKPATVILLNGQSNASGVGSVNYLEAKSGPDDFNRYEDGYDNIFINFFSENGNHSSQSRFIKAKIGQGCTPDYIGPELGLADLLAQQYPDQLFFILKYSWGGSNLHTRWRAPSSRGDTGDLYEAFINFTTASMDYLRAKNYAVFIDAMCWMQGESDAYSPHAQNYKNNLTYFVRDIRRNLGEYTDDELHFIDAGIYDSPLVTEYITINQAKRDVAALSLNNHYFDTIDAGLTYNQEPEENPDLAHFDALSTLQLGYLFANQVIDILS